MKPMNEAVLLIDNRRGEHQISTATMIVSFSHGTRVQIPKISTIAAHTIAFILAANSTHVGFIILLDVSIWLNVA